MQIVLEGQSVDALDTAAIEVINYTNLSEAPPA